MTIRISSASLSDRARNVLYAHFKARNILPEQATLALLAESATEIDLRRIKGCGSLTLHEIRECLRRHGLTLRETNTPAKRKAGRPPAEQPRMPAREIRIPVAAWDRAKEYAEWAGIEVVDALWPLVALGHEAWSKR